MPRGRVGGGTLLDPTVANVSESEAIDDLIQ
jgi:hypothetical protein